MDPLREETDGFGVEEEAPQMTRIRHEDVDIHRDESCHSGSCPLKMSSLTSTMTNKTGAKTRSPDHHMALPRRRVDSSHMHVLLALHSLSSR